MGYQFANTEYITLDRKFRSMLFPKRIATFLKFPFFSGKSVHEITLGPCIRVRNPWAPV